MALAVLGAGCGVPTDDRARGLRADDVPFDLLAADPRTTTTSSLPAAPSTVTIFLVGRAQGGRDRLIAVSRSVSSPASVEKVISALVSGPTEEEIGNGLRSAITPATTVVSAPVELGIATIDVTETFVVGSQSEQIVALAQMVYTATSLAGVVGVRFTLNGQKAQVPQGDGTITRAPVGRAAYASLAPLSG